MSGVFSKVNYCGLDGITPEIRKHRENFKTQILDTFNSSENITRSLGKLDGDKDMIAREALYSLAERVLDGKPLDPSFVLKEGDYKRIRHEINKLNKDLKKGTSLSTFALTTMTPRAIADRYPNLRKFMDDMDNITLYEKNAFNKFQNNRKLISSSLKKAFMGQNIKMRGVLNRLDKIQGDIFAEYMKDSPDSTKISGYLNLLKDSVDKNSKKLLGDYFSFIELNPERVFLDSEGNHIKKHLIKDLDINGNVIGTRKLDDNIIAAGNHTRALLKDMGEVLVSSLRASGMMAKYVESNLSRNNKNLINPSRIKRIKFLADEIDNSIKDIEMGVKKGNYFPHYILTDMLRLKKASNENIVNGGKDSVKALEGISEYVLKIKSDIMDVNRINRSKKRSDILNQKDPISRLWDHNPLGALTRYSSDVISFNRLSNMQLKYTKAIGDLEGVSGDVIESMRSFINHQFDTATLGYTQRPGWVNKTTRAISAYEFASKLGFGVTTGLRNFISGAYFVSHMGGKFFNYLNTYKDLPSDDKVFLDKLMGEIGFKFLDTKRTLDDLTAEGLLPSSGVREDSLYYDTHEEVWKYEHNGVMKSIGEAANSVIGASAGIQRATENALRTNMFRADFMRQIEIYSSQEQFSGKIGKEKLYRMAAKMAAKKVNKFAFDYSVYNKSRSIGGTHKAGGAVGQMLGVFMHYPMAFANLQVNAFRDSFAAMKSGQGWSNTDVQLAMGFTGMYLTTNLLSGVFNMDMEFFLNNDTVDRIEAMYSYLTADDPEERRRITYGSGASALVSGPVIGDVRKAANGLIHTAVALDFINKPDSEMLDFLTGYEEFAKKTGDEKTLMFLRMINNQGFKIGTQTIPAIANGRPGQALIKELHIYPTKKSEKIRTNLNTLTRELMGKEFLSDRSGDARLRELAKMLS